MSKEIEEGCRAIIINTGLGHEEYIGTEITVGAYSVKHHSWFIPEFETRSRVFLIREKDLKRIDDYDGDQVTSWSSLKDIYNPEKVGA